MEPTMGINLKWARIEALDQKLMVVPSNSDASRVG